MRYSGVLFQCRVVSLYRNLPSYEHTCRTNEDSTFCSVQVAVDTDVLWLTGKAEAKEQYLSEQQPKLQTSSSIPAGPGVYTSMFTVSTWYFGSLARLTFSVRVCHTRTYGGRG